MSRVSLSGNALGTGTFTIASPNSNTDRTLTLPDASGTLNTSGAPNEVPAGSAAAPALTTTGDTNTGIFFPAADTIAFAEGGAEVARFDANGNLGVGTTSPGARTEIFNSSGSNILRLSRSATDRLDFYAGSGVSYIDSSPAGGQLAFATVGTERARIDSSGNLLVATNTSGGQGGMSVRIGGFTPNVLFNRINTTAQSFPLEFQNAGTIVGYVGYNNTSTFYVTSSDYRLKEDIQPMTGALAKVAALKPCTYKWNADGSDGEGFIAHELAEVCPQAVVGEKDAVDADGKPQYQGIDTSFLVATLTAAIQELKAELDGVKAELATLKGQA
jgi:hypothetical protein